MLKIDNEKRISITRGDSGTITITANDSDGSTHNFSIGDILRLKVMMKGDVSNIVLTKDVTAVAAGTSVDMALTSTDTLIGELINKPVTYWYEIELNPGLNSNTIICYDEDGPKEFVLYPEASGE